MMKHIYRNDNLARVTEIIIIISSVKNHAAIAIQPAKNTQMRW
jgi:hypothetical protein